MRKLLMIWVATMALCSVARADEGAQQGVKRVKSFVEKLARYEVKFNVLAGDLIYVGEYSVDGDSYYIKMDNIEVYSNGKERYEVDRERKEVSIDVVDQSSTNILDNPTRCFDFAEKDYKAEIQSCKDGEMTIYLDPTDPQQDGEIYLTIDEQSGRPKKIVYVMYDDQIEVSIDSIKSRKEPIKRFDKSAYKGYEMVDFR